jgi:hypothetical protein
MATIRNVGARILVTRLPDDYLTRLPFSLEAADDVRELLR